MFLLWVIPRRLKFICRRFGTLSLFHLHRCFMQEAAHITYEDGSGCSETSARNIQKPGNNPEERIKHSDHGESLKSIISYIVKHVIYKIKLLLLLLVVETSVHVVPYVQVSGSFLKPKWIRSLCLHCVRYRWQQQRNYCRLKNLVNDSLLLAID